VGNNSHVQLFVQKLRMIIRMTIEIWLWYGLYGFDETGSALRIVKLLWIVLNLRPD